MPRPATGVDIGSSSAKLVSGEVKGNSFTVRSFSFALNGDGTLEGGWRALGELGKVGTVRVGLNGREVNLRYTRVPRLPDWQLKRLMRFETEEIGGQSEAEVASDFNVLPEMPEIEGEDVVLLALAREALLDEHLDGLAGAGGKLEAFTPNAVALYNAFLHYGVVQEDTVLVADIGQEYLNVVLVRGTDLVFARNLSGGSRLFDRAIAERFGVEEARARAYRLTDGTLESGKPFKDPNQEKASRALAAPAGQILSLLQSAVVFAKSQVKLSSLKLDRVLVCGGGAALPGLCGYLARGLSVPVELFDPFRVVDVSRLDPDSAELLEQHKLEAIVALGLATTASDPEAYSIEILPGKVRRRREFAQGTAFLIAAAALAVLFLGLRAWNYRSELGALRVEEQNLSRQVQRVDKNSRQTTALVEENRSLSEHAQDLHALAGAGEQMVRTLDALERDLPSDFWIESMSMAWGFDPDLGIARGSERPILHVRGRAREGTDSPAALFEDFTAALAARLGEARVKPRMGEADFTLDLSALGARSAPGPSEQDAAGEQADGPAKAGASGKSGKSAEQP